MVCQRMSVITELCLLSALIVHISEGKHWPDFSCHPSNDTVTHRNAFLYYRMGWESCKENYEVNKGRCDKICVLIKRAILFRNHKNDPFAFNTEAFLVIFREELGYSKKDSPPPAVQELVTKVKLGLEDCKIKYPAYATLPVKNTPCEPWGNFTRCIDEAVVRAINQRTPNGTCSF